MENKKVYCKNCGRFDRIHFTCTIYWFNLEKGNGNNDCEYYEEKK